MVNRRVGNLRKDRDRGGKKGGFFSRYRPPPDDHVKRQAERKGGKFDSIFKGNFDTFTPKEGDNTLRILPPGWDGAGDYAFPVWIHWSVGADESSYLCLRKMKGETCPICQEVARMKADGEGEDAKRIDCKERFICWVIDRSDRDETPSLYSMPAGTYKDINALCYSSKSGKAIFIDNPDNGYDVIIRRTGTKINTKYLPQVDREATAVTDDADKYKELEAWVQDNQIPDCLQYFDADYLEKALSGEIDRNKGDDEDEDRSSRRSKVKSRRDEPEDDEDDSPPPRSKRGKARDDEDDDLDDELPFDEDDEDDDREAESRKEAREVRQDRQARSRGKGREDDDDEPEDRPRGNKARSRRDEDDDEDDDPPSRVGDDEEDDDPPPRKSGRTRARDDDEDDNPRQRPKADRDRGSRSSGNRRV